MRLRRHALLLAAAFALPAAGVWACGETLGPGARRIDAAPVALAYRLLPDPVPVSQHFAIEIELCAEAGAKLPAELRVDASMPEHRHGMNYRPSVKRLAPGRYRADGLMFHMPGRWELAFELRGPGADAAPLRLTQSLQVR